MFNKKRSKKGFTIIELIVVMVVIGVLVLLAMPKFMGYTEKARLTELKNNIKQLENASERYYIDHQDWPRLGNTPYTATELESFTKEIKNRTGAIITLDPMGNYYKIDYNKLQTYVQKPKTGIYILQNPVGEVFYLENIKDLESKNPVSHEKDTVINLPCETDENINWYGLESQAFDRDDTTSALVHATTNQAAKAKITWDGNLTNKGVYINIDFSYTTFAIKDSNGVALKFTSPSGDIVDNLYYASGRIVGNITIPENAAYIEIVTPGGHKTTIYDIHETSDLTCPGYVSNLKAVKNMTTIKLNWTNPMDSDLKTVYIYRDNVKLGETINGTFTDLTGLYANTDYTYEVRVMDTSGNISISTITAKTLPREMYWHGLKAHAFDMDDTTSALIHATTNHAAKDKITWDGDLTNKGVYINIDFSYTTFTIKDSNGIALKFTSPSGDIVDNLYYASGRIVGNITIPENAAYIEIVTPGGHKTTIYDIHEVGIN